MTKQKPTKVTHDDIELAEELSRITTIKGLVGELDSALKERFAALTKISEQGNPVATHLAIIDTRDALEFKLQDVAISMYHSLGQVEKEDAEMLAGEDDEVEMTQVGENEVLLPPAAAPGPEDVLLGGGSAGEQDSD